MSRTPNPTHTKAGQNYDLVSGASESFRKEDVQYLQQASAHETHDGVETGLPIRDRLNVETTYVAGRITQVLRKEGATTIAQEDIAYLANGNVDTVTEIIDGITSVSTFAYNADGTVNTVTRT